MKTDSQLQEDVIAELKRDPTVAATKIGVVAKEGVVTLSGQVLTLAEKLNVEQVAQRVPGVEALAIELRVTVIGHASVGDAEVARCVEAGLKSTKGVRARTLRVVVEGGKVTLSGDVDSANEKAAALDSVRYLRGVKAVTDEIVVKPTVSVDAVRGGIDAELHHLAALDALKIAVSICGDEVTLSGSVQTWSQGRAVIKSVERTPGVRHVLDNLTIDE